MQSIRKVCLHKNAIPLVAAGVASVWATSGVSHDDRHLPKLVLRNNVLVHPSMGLSETMTKCESLEPKTKPEPIPSSRPSWIRRSLASLKILSLPVPRVLVQGDPAFRMDPRLLQKRQQDEIEMQNLVRGAIQSQQRSPTALQALNDKCLELAYGEGVTLKKRQDFVHVSACQW